MNTVCATPTCSCENGHRTPSERIPIWTPLVSSACTTRISRLVSRFAHRLLDCIWSATPIICTAGDVLAPVVQSEEIGIVVPAGDLDAIVAALHSLATDRERVTDMRCRLRALAPRFRWHASAAPLVAWCERLPSREAERFAVTGLDPALGSSPQLPTSSAAGLKMLIPRPVRQHVLGPLKRRLGQSG